MTNISYEFTDNCVDQAYLLSREKFSVPDYAILVPSLIESEIPYSIAMKWINNNAKAIHTLLNQYSVDPDIGLVLVLTQWSAPGYSRVVIPSNLAEEGVVMGLANGTTWVEGNPPEGKPLTLTMVEHYEVPHLPLVPVLICAEGDGVDAFREWAIDSKGFDNA